MKKTQTTQEQGTKSFGTGSLDTVSIGTEIIVAEGSPLVPDVVIEEPTYPVHEWQDQPEPAIIVPDDAMSDDALVAGIQHLQGSLVIRLRRTLQEHWAIGKALQILFARHGVDHIGPDGKTIKSNWRSEWLPKLEINHTSDYQLREMAETYTLDQIGQFSSKTEALRAAGLLAPKAPKAIDHSGGQGNQEAATQGAPHGEGLSHAGSHGKQEGAPEGAQPVGGSPHAAPKAGSTPQTASTSVPGKSVSLTGAGSKSIVQKATEPTPDPAKDEPEGVGADALVLTLRGAKPADVEEHFEKAGVVLLSKKPGRLVALLWIGDDDYEGATAKVRKTLDKVRAGHSKLTVEAHYLYPGDVVAV